MHTTGPEQVTARLSVDQINDLTACLIRIPVLFLEAARTLREEHYTGIDESANRLIWIKLLELHGKHGTLPGRFILESEVGSAIEALPEDFRAEAYARSDAIMAVAFEFTEEDTKSPDLYNFASELLRNFLRERDVIDRLRTWIDSLNGGVPMDMGDAVRALQERVVSVESVGSDPFEDMELSRPVEGAFQTEPSGISFLDGPMGGGLLLRECFGLLGAQGSGKTMLGVQTSVQTVFTQYTKSIADPGYEPGHVYFISYEQPRYQILMRAVSVAARIPLSRLRAIGYGQKDWINGLSTPGHLEDYEKELEVVGGVAMSERERYDNYVPSISKYWHVAGFSGTKADGTVVCGNGFVEEIAAVIEKRQNTASHKISLVVVDYALLACRRYLLSRNMDPTKSLRHYLGVFGNACKTLIAENFGCAVMVLSQLSGEANSRSPLAKVTHADGAECKSFTENLAYNFALGTKHAETSCVLLHSQKTRHSDNEDTSRFVLRFNKFGHLVDASDEYSFDDGGFIPKSFTSKLARPVDKSPTIPKSHLSDLARPRMR